MNILTNSKVFEYATFESVLDWTVAGVVVVAFNRNSYPSKRSETTLVDLVIFTPFRLIAASAAATTCLLAFVDVVSNCASPSSPLVSLTENRSAFFEPVSELTISENVPSPLSVTAAFTPVIVFRESARELKLLFAEFTCIL